MRQGIEEDIKTESFVAVAEMLRSADAQQVTNEEEAATCKAFLGILQSLYKEQLYVIKSIRSAGEVLAAKLKQYEQTNLSIEDL